MQIHFKDFFPATTKTGILSRTQESFVDTLGRANAWLASSGVQAINVETVVFPNISAKDSSKVDAVIMGDFAAEWHQFIRIWYEMPTA